MEYKVGVVHGRFQPPHKGHIRYIKEALLRTEHLIIGICTPKICTKEEAEKTGYPCTLELNPLTFKERKDMFELSLSDIPKERYSLIEFPSDYTNIQELVPKDAVFLMSKTTEGDKEKIQYLESLGYMTKTILEVNGDRERSGLVRDDPEKWKDMVPEVVFTYMESTGIIQRLKHAKLTK